MSRLRVLSEFAGARLEGTPATREEVFTHTASVLVKTSRGGHYVAHPPHWGRRAMEAIHWLRFTGAREFLAVAEIGETEVFLSMEDLRRLVAKGWLCRETSDQILAEIRQR